jgi:hypothetical protein
LIARDITFNLVLVHYHRSGSWLMAESSDEGWIMAAATATGGGGPASSCAASMAGRWFIALGIANRWRGGATRGESMSCV